MTSNRHVKMQQIYDCTLRHPARVIVYGPSFSGKSTFVYKLLENQKKVFDEIFDRIIICNGGSTTKLPQNLVMENYDYLDSSIIESLDKNQKNIVLIDDNMHRAANDLNISELFTKKSHHSNTTVIFIIQNLFPKSEFMTDIRRNATYIFLMSNPSENKSVRLFSSQVDSENPKFISNCFADATRNKPFSHLLLDFHQQQLNEVRVRSNLLADNENEKIVCYIKSQEYSELCRRTPQIGENSKR